eukprot:1147034-Pelagomonas_calceolata.AAC.2
MCFLPCAGEVSGQERHPASPPTPGTAPRTAAPSIAAPSLLAAPQVLHQSSPYHAVSARQVRANKGHGLLPWKQQQQQQQWQQK